MLNHTVCRLCAGAHVHEAACKSLTSLFASQSYVLFRLAYLSATDSWRISGEELRGRTDAVEQDLPSTWAAQRPLVQQLLWGLIWPPKVSASQSAGTALPFQRRAHSCLRADE